MTYALFLQIENSDKTANEKGRIVRVAIMSEDHDLETLDNDFDTILDTWERQYGFRPSELDNERDEQ